MNVGSKQGAIGAEVERLHRVLMSLGIAVADDKRAVNVFGPYTLEALSAFQCDRGLSVTILRTSASSGRPYSVSPSDAANFGGSTSDSYLDNPRYTGARDSGPIPEGTYRFDASKMVTFSGTEQTTILTSGGTDPFGKNIHAGDWGAGRAELTPTRILPTPFGRDPTAPGKRSGFYIHGGIQAGSSGCIDVGDTGITSIASALSGYTGHVTIDVHYTQPPPTVGTVQRALGRFAYPPEHDPSIIDRLKAAAGIGTDH